MRAGEIKSLLRRQVNLEKRTAHHTETKNGSARTVPLTREAVAVFRLALANPVRPIDTDLIFFGEPGLGDQEVAAISGHKSMQMLRRYTHLRAEDLVSRLDQLGIIGGACPDPHGTERHRPCHWPRSGVVTWAATPTTARPSGRYSE